MARQRVVVDGSSVTAHQLQDLFRQIGDGSIGRREIQAFLEHRDPFCDAEQSAQNDELFQMFANGTAIIRKVKVNQGRTFQQLLEATGRTQNVDQEVVASAPRPQHEDEEVIFVLFGRYLSDDALDVECDKLGLELIDPITLSRANIDDPAFSDEYSNATHWKDSNGRWCYSAFGRWFDERYVLVNRSDNDWLGSWWFGCVRKRT